MSNLKLTNLSFQSLCEFLGNRPKAKIAYETTATRLEDGAILIRHHDNPIAQIWHDKVFLTNAGWTSRTTTARLHRIAQDNLGLKYGVAIRKFRQVLMVDSDSQEWPENGVTISKSGVSK